MKIGLPRALTYYEYGGLAQTFLEMLDQEVVISPPTQEEIMRLGTSLCVDEACLPVKLFHGHAAWLKDRVDAIFLPVLKGVARHEYMCPKMIGLTDMVRHSIPGLPRIISPLIEISGSLHSVRRTLRELGREFTSDRTRVETAVGMALAEHMSVLEALRAGELPIEGWRPPLEPILRVGVVGHSYTLYDRHVSMDLIRKLSAMNVAVVTPEMLDAGETRRTADELPKKIFWTLPKRQAGAALMLGADPGIDGIIFVAAYGCGIDAFIGDLCERMIQRKRNLPFMTLTLDEHSGPAGMETRVEAFIDMLERRLGDGGDISPDGDAEHLGQVFAG